MLSLRKISLAALLTLGLGLPVSAGDRLGWEGQPLPSGLVKAEHPGEYLYEKDGAIMVFVPAGNFLRGSLREKDEQPIRSIYLDGFYMDRDEVSWARWQKSDLPVPKPPDWGILPNHPVLNVNWSQAQAFAHWAGKELPTEAQWEKAARGTDDRLFPWGDTPPTFEQAIWKEHPIAAETTAPVDCCEAGASPYGVRNLAGNVYEWCLDVYAKDFYTTGPNRNPLNLSPGDFRVLRGGAFVLEIEDMYTTYRYRLREIDRTPYMGFRTVLPVQSGRR